MQAVMSVSLAIAMVQLSNIIRCANMLGLGRVGLERVATMVTRQVNSETGATQIVVTANKSMSWRANVIFAACLGATSAVFGGVIASFGFWMVLPFAGLEFLLVMLCLGQAYKRLGYMEVISKKGDILRVESGYDQPARTSELPSHWTQVQFEDPSSAFDVGRLFLKCSGKSLEIGQALGKEEKRMLYKEVLHCLRVDQPDLTLVN